MSQRGKRQPNKTDDGPVATKRRKCRPTAAEEEEAAAALAAASGSGSWTPRPLNDLKISSIYNRSATEAPAELFRKDLISAMKLPDSEPLALDEYWVITDQWKQEWERGVQVPVNPDSLPEPTVTVNHCATRERGHQFKLPKSKYVRITKDEFFTTDEHYLSNTPAKAEKACAYDLDDTDAAWLKVLNGERASMGLPPINEDQLERVIEQLEIRCWEKVQTIVKTEEGLGIEFDENVICDVCRSPDSEEGNEMVFCDCCNICVHQACYGITTIPSGSWLCRTCFLGQRPECVLCPNKGGAMKCTRSGQKWAHVSCALWIPEVSIGCVERMEPITKISSIPQSRWALICVLCRERVGACIQCSVKTCKTAYHVTCAFKHGLEMKAIIEDENADDGVKLRSYCQKHSVKKEKCGSQSEDEESRRRKRKDMTSEEKNQARAAKLQEIEAEFDKHVSIKDVTQTMEVDLEGVHHIYNYWKLKRKAGFNRPLLPPRSEDVDILSRQQEQADIEKMKNFVQLRQDLERVRNLCYMVSRREKLSRSFFRMREQTFHKQVAVLSDPNCVLKSKEVAAIIQANHGPSIYDRLYSQPSAEEGASQFDLVLARIAGIASPPPVEDKPKVDLNGLVKRPGKSSDNPYKRMYFNGSGRRRSSLYGSMSSASETDSTRRQTSSSQDEGNVGNSASATKIVTKKRSKKSVVSRTRTDASTSEDDEKPAKSAWQAPRNRTLRQMEREMNSATDDSDELLPMKPTKSEPHKITAIYSDSDSDPSKGTVSEEDKAPSDSQQHVLRTKAAMKEFSAGLQPKVDRSSQKSNKVSRSAKTVADKSITRDDSMDDDSTKDKENVKSTKKVEYDPSDLIVPQRQAAKKASESIRCSQGKSKEQILFEQEALKTSPVNEEQKVKQKTKHKSKESKDGKSSDIYDFEKEVIEADAPEILAYVPQRQAAKKAAQHIKSGMTKPLPGTAEVESAEGGKGKKDLPDLTKSKKEIDIPKSSKKEVDSEKLKRSKSPDSKGKMPSKSREILSSSSSSSSSGDSSSSSDSESDDKAKTFKKDKVEKKELASPVKESEKKPKRITGKSNEDWPFLDKGDQSSRSSSSSRGSDSSDDSDMFTRKKGSISPHKSTTKGKEGSPSKHVGKKFTKAPDKKLKTSDGRPEPEFQPPFLERDEPSRTKESLGRGRKAGASTSDRIGNTDGRSRNLLVSPGRSQGRHSSTSSGDRPRAPRTAEQLPDPDGRKHRKEQSKSEGGKRKSSEVHSGDSSLRKEASKSSQLHSIKKTDKKVTSSDNKSDRKSEKKEGRDTVAIRLEKEIANRKADKTSSSKKSSKVSPLDRLFDKRDSKIEKLVNKKKVEQGSTSPVKVSSKEEAIPKHKQSLPKESHKKLSPSQEISSKRAFRERDLFGVEDSDKKNKSTERDVPSKATKHNAIITANTPKSSPKHSKEPTHRKGDMANVRRREDKTSSPKKDHRVSTDEKRLSLDLNEITQKREKDIRRESTESLASVSSDIDDDKTKKKAKPMPKCKKQALGILSDSQENPEIKMDEVLDEKDQMPNVILPNEPVIPPEEMVAMVEEMIPSTKQSNDPVMLADEQSKPDVQHVAGTFRPIPQLEKPDSVEELPVPDPEPEPQKITSRTSSLYQQRSIFSPQQPKDPAVAELFDFENDILAVDETVNDDGFSMARDTEELMRPLTFSFSSEFLFKEESKEDSERETLNLVEKLRLEYAKKSTTGPGQGDASSVGVEDEETAVIIEEKPPELPEVEIVEPPKSNELKEPSPIEASIGGPRSIESCAVENKVLPASTPNPSSQLEPQDIPLKAPPYAGYEYNSCNVPVSMPGREKLDRSNSDERWVPPSGMEFVQQRLHHYEVHPPDTPAPSPYTDLQARAKWADSEVLPVRRSSSSSASSSSSSSHREDLELQKRDELLYSSVVAELYQGVHQGIPSFPPCALDVHSYHPYSDATQFVGPVALFPPACAQLPFPSPGAAMFPPPFGPPFSTAQLLPPVPKPPEEPHMPPPCGAAFTSSSHNMALTAAMVSPPPQVPTPSPVLHPEPITINTEPLHLNQQPLSMEPEPVSSDREPEPTLLPNDTIVNHDIVKESPIPKPATNPPGKKSPTKPTRTSARVTSQLSKSPGKSPRQQEQIPAKSPARVRDTGSKRGKGSANRGSHGQNRGGSRRGRGRGRGSMHYQDMDYNTIHSKLAGTVYDLEFDDDSPSEGVESMRAMRERRRSSDHHDRKMGLDYGSQDLSQSPKFGNSPHQNSKLRYGMDARDLRPPTPMSGHRTPADEELMPPPSPLATNERVEHFPDVVRPLLPGPVDMRTYSSTGYEPSPANNPAAYHNHLLGQFATAAAEQHVTDFVEDLEKELHTALAASKSSETFRAEEIKIADVTAANDDSVSQIKVSLSDSRNQLKVKIKGPFLDANYSASSVTQQQVVLPIPPDVVAAASVVPIAATNAFNVGASTGTSNLRRMRKKELLRQYCSQDMNMIDPAGGPMLGGVAPPTAAPPVSRTVITIPKAVASMTTIPTREDYKAVVDANMEKKRRKEKATLSSSLSGPRELRHLDLTLGLEESDLPERRRSVGSTGSNGSVQFDVSNHPVKRRGRPAKPVLKIKIGNSVISEESNEEKRLRVRPPKKRLSSVPMPSMEEMKRESMKFRKMIMADFEQEEKKRSKSVGGKRRKKHGDQRHEVRIVASESEQASGTKLIIRFNKCASGEPPEDPGGGRTSLPSGPQESLPPDKDKLLTVPVSVSEKKGPSPLLKVRTSKMTPIRLKLSRCHEGYVMKKPLVDPLAPVSEPNVSVNDSEQSLNNSSAGSSVPVNQGCEVR